MYFNLFVKGIIIGLSIAAPVGPIGILCIRRTLTNGRTAGLLSGLGAASADAFYGLIAILGFTVITNTLISYRQEISVIGGIFLCYLGVKTLLSKAIDTQILPNDKKLVGSYFSTLLLTLTNPMTILLFMAVFASLGTNEVSSSFVSLIFVFGVFLGSVLWWFILTMAVGFLSSKLDGTYLRAVKIISGAILLIFGLKALSMFIHFSP